MNKLSLIITSLFGLAQLYSCSASAVKCEPVSDEKIVVYQVFTRLFGSDKPNPIVDGSLSQNGVGKFADFTATALDSIAAMGMTHIWYTGVIEHASIYSTDTVGGLHSNHPGVIKGKAGSPYAIKDYYDVNGYLASSLNTRMQEFESLIDRSHKANLKVIIDFVPNHVARGYHSDVAPKDVKDFGIDDDVSCAFKANNNFYYIPNKPLKPQFATNKECKAYEEFPAKATGNDVFSAEPKIEDWYETVKLNYGVDYENGKASYFDPLPNTWTKMRDILLFWASKGVDGFRCDMAEMVPCEFWQWAIAEVKAEYPDLVFIAEIYNPQAYEDYIKRGGFDYLYDKVGLYDTLKAIVQGRASTSAISADRQKIAPVQQHMLNFLENHDEQRIAWKEFAGDAKAGIPMMLVSTLSDNIPMMVYFGQELGEESPDETGFSGADGRSTIFDFWTLPLYQAWRNGGKFDGAGLTVEQKKLRSQYISILKMANEELAFRDGEFIDLTLANPNSSSKVYAFVRCTESEAALVVVNLSNEKVKTSYELPKSLKAFPSTSFKNVIFNNGKINSCDGLESDIFLRESNVIELDLEPYRSIVLKN
ncbi:MAG: alpha-amylase family glycosyl hydrolase [Rikenellaceae bacterium]